MVAAAAKGTKRRCRVALAAHAMHKVAIYGIDWIEGLASHTGEHDGRRRPARPAVYKAELVGEEPRSVRAHTGARLPAFALPEPHLLYAVHEFS